MERLGNARRRNVAVVNPEVRDRLLDAYLPRDRRVALAENRSLPDRTSGSVLFADVKAYSALTTSLLEELGPERGAEELTRRLNVMVSAAVEHVHRYGGSVIGYAGDGVTCWFDGDNGLRATAAALATQDFLHAHGESNRVKIVVTSGLARRFVVGVPRIQRFDVLAGGILDRMAAAEGLAQTGEVLVGGEIVGWLRDQVEIIDWRQGPGSHGESFAVIAGRANRLAPEVQEQTVPPLPEEVSREWINPVIYRRIESGEGDSLSELKSVVALFVRFSGIQYDFDNQAGNKLGAYIEWVQKTLVSLSGFVTQVIVGDKGSYLFAAFGAPLSHEDDGLRALRAASALMDLPPHLDFISSTSAGLSEGKMHAGVFGRSAHRSYEVLGNAANEAATLMELAAAGEVLVSGSLYESVRNHYSLQPTNGGFRLLGPTETPRVLAPRGLSDGEMVGREQERNRLRTALDSLLEGQTQVVVVQGPAGIGKSRLLVDLDAQAQSLTIPTFAGAGNAIDADAPLHAWKTIFAGVLGLPPAPDEAAVLAALQVRLTPELFTLAPLLNPVLGVELAENETTALIPAESRSDNAQEVMVECLLRPLGTLGVMLIMIDDCQWLDSASWTLLETVVHRHPALLVVLATRPPESSAASRGPGWIERYIAERPENLLVMSPLSDGDVEELIKKYMGVRDVPDALREVVLERADGNPFFAQEIVAALMQRRLVEINDGVSRVLAGRDELAAAFPERLEKLLISRLDLLPSDLRTTVLVASVLGRVFGLKMLAEVHPSHPEEKAVRLQLDDLAGYGLLTVEREEPEPAYRFRHSLTHQAAEELLPAQMRGDIQGDAAAWIESNLASNLVPHYPTLARYLEAAGDITKALHYLELAGENARAAGASIEAIGLYRRAIALADGRDDVPRDKVAVWQLRLGEIYVHHQSEDVTKGRANLEAGLAALGFGLPATTAGRLLGLLGQVLTQARHRIAGPRSVRAPSAERLLMASRAYERLVEVYYISGEDVRSLYASMRSLNLAEAAGPSPERVRGWATAGGLLGFVPLRNVAASYLERALKAAEPEEPAARAWAALVAGFYYTGVGDWARAGQLMEQVVELSSQVGDGRRLEDGLSNLMMQAYLRGNLARGLELTEELERRAHARRADRPLAYFLQGRAYCLLDLGEPEKALQIIDRLEEVQSRDRSADQALISDTYGLEALAEARRGNIPRAVTAADLLMSRLAGKPPSNYSTIAAYSAPAEVYGEAWRQEPSSRGLRRQMRSALEILGRYARVFPIGRPRLLLWQGRYQALHGRENDARQTITRSKQEAAQLGMGVDEMRAVLELERLADDAAMLGSRAS